MTDTTNTENDIKKRFLKLMRFIIADLDQYGIRNDGEFADRIGCFRSNLSRMKNTDGMMVPILWIHNMAMTFDFSSDWVITGRGAMPTGPGKGYKNKGKTKR